MKVKFGVTFVSVIILAAVTFMAVGFEAETGCISGVSGLQPIRSIPRIR